MEEKIRKALEAVRPSLQMDGGDIEFVSWDEKTGVVQVRFQGMCVGCPMSQMTLKNGVEAEIKNEVPEVRAVIAV